jgi:hypothetical protein
MTEPQQKRPVVFAGENPIIQLHAIGGQEVVAAASVWICTHSEHGTGYAFFLWTDPEGSGLAEEALTGVYTDNPALARLVWENFNGHWWPHQNRGLDRAEPQPARFEVQAGGRRFHRMTCLSGTTVIELIWSDVQDVFHYTGDAPLAETNWLVSNVMCPCARAEIWVNGRRVAGEVRQTGEAFQSSAFLAFCESWVRR